MLLLAPLFVAALLATGALGVALLTGRRPKGSKVGAAVAIEFLPENSSWVVKVYRDRGLYLAHVYKDAEYLNHRAGFSTIKRAVDWGFAYARERL